MDAVSIAILKFILQILIGCLELHQPLGTNTQQRTSQWHGKQQFWKASHRAASKGLLCSAASCITISLSPWSTFKFLPQVLWLRFIEKAQKANTDLSTTSQWQKIHPESGYDMKFEDLDQTYSVSYHSPCEVALSSNNYFVYSLHKNLSRLHLILGHRLLCTNI